MPQGLGLGLGYGAGAGADALTDLLARRFFEMMQQQRLEEDKRQFDTTHGENVRQFDTTFGEGQRRFAVTSKQTDRRLSQDERNQKFLEYKYANEEPQRLLDAGYTKARIQQILREPKDAERRYSHEMNLEDVRTRNDKDLVRLRASLEGGGGGDGRPKVDAIMDQIEVLSGRINTGGAGIGTTLSGLARKGRGMLNLDNDAAEYESLVKGMIPMVARAVGHTGVLTQQDVDSVRALFPSIRDNRELAQNKLNRVRALIGSGGGAPSRAIDTSGGGTPKRSAQDILNAYRNRSMPKRSAQDILNAARNR